MIVGTLQLNYCEEYALDLVKAFIEEKIGSAFSELIIDNVKINLFQVFRHLILSAILVYTS